MLTATVSGRVVELPEELAGFFGQDRQVQVTQYQDHVALWRRWSRTSRGREHPPKASRRNLFAEAGRRYRAALDLSTAWPAGIASYLAGYAVECRLKALICDLQQAPDLAQAAHSLAQWKGRKYDLVGADGHDLALLWDLAGLKSAAADRDVMADAQLVVSWDTSWRYSAPLKHEAAFVAAVKRLYDYLEAYQ